MSFRCSDCKKARDYCETPVRLVVETRKAQTGFGTEIVKEIEVCIHCAVKREPENKELLRRLVVSQRPVRVMTGVES